MGTYKKSQCKNGHDLSGDNVIKIKRGQTIERACRICTNERKRAWWQRNRGKNNG